MSTETVNLFLAFLTLGGVAALAVATTAAIVAAATGARARMMTELGPYGLAMAFFVAVTAVAGSLYYSEVADFEPCRLCWLQRYCMYPAALVLGLSFRWAWLRFVAFGLAVVGLGVSIYHRLEQQFPDDIGGSCALDNPCSGRWVDTFGVITIPTMAGVAFALILLFVLLAHVADNRGDAA